MVFLVEVQIVDVIKAQKFLQEHLNYLNKHFENGNFLCFGSFPNSQGGAVIAQAASAEKLQQILDKDPLQSASCAQWKVTEYKIAKARALPTAKCNKPKSI